MDAATLNKTAGNTNPNANWCCLIDNLPAAGSGDGPAPCQPTKLFQWLSAKNLPRLEDETPPSSFYEVLENAEVAFHCTHCDKLLVSLNAQTLQRSAATQTQGQGQGQGQAHIQAKTGTATEIPKVETRTHAVTQTYRQIQAQTDNQTQTYSDDLMLEQEQELDPLAVAEEPLASETATFQRPLLEAIQQVLGLRMRGRSLWSLLKTLLLLISLLHSCYVMCRCLNRLPMLRHLILSTHSVAMPPPPPPPQRSLPAFIWGQLCRVARKLNIM